MADHVLHKEKTSKPPCPHGEDTDLEGRGVGEVEEGGAPEVNPAAGKPPAVRDDTMSYYVDAGVLVTFPTSTSEQRQQDILYSLLFAQLAADKDHDRRTDPRGWFSYFQYVLRNIGWVLTDLKFDVDVSEGFFVFTSLVLNLLVENGKMTESIAAFRTLFNTLHGLPDTDSAVEVLYEQTYDQATYATSLILCSFEETADKEVKLDVVMVGFGGLTEKAYRYLFHVYDSSAVTFDQAEACSMVLNETVFRKVRESVVEKLGDKVKTFIKEVKSVKC